MLLGTMVWWGSNGVVGTGPSAVSAGDWPTPRQNVHLTARQPLPGGMTGPPRLLARYDLGRGWPSLIPARTAGGKVEYGLAVVGGALRCYNLDGKLRWKSHPPGLNFLEISKVEDLDGDGRTEVALRAGRSADPYGAAALVHLADGSLLWRYDVEPMSYAWSLHIGHFLPGATHQQLIVLMQGYPPDRQNGYIALFEFPGPGEVPRQRWRYDFDQYTCFPILLQTDLDGDGVKELCVETHSRMWLLDARTGTVKQFYGWDVSPANVRSYGLGRFLDLNGDGREDFLCIANFSQHHEVLLNENSQMKQAWHYGWAESVTTGKVATTWPEPPVADVDGDGRLEVIVSMFNSEGEQNWRIRVYDAVTGTIQAKIPGLIAVAVADVDGDGAAEILAHASSDPTLTQITGCRIVKWAEGSAQECWRADESALRASSNTADADGDGHLDFLLQQGKEVVALGLGPAGTLVEKPYTPSPPPPTPDFSKIPPLLGPPPPPLLAADLDGDGRNEILLYRNGTAEVLAWKPNGSWGTQGRYPSSALPALADLDGDGHLEIITGTVSPNAPPVVEAQTPALEDRLLWRCEFPPPDRIGLPYGRPMYFQIGRFTGRETPDVYVWAGTPLVRSAVLEGRTGTLVWERGEIPRMERYWGPGVNHAAVYDFDQDGNDDLVFTNPDYYCITSGPTGELLEGPAFPPTIFHQPSQGLYTLPALLENPTGEPTVCLVDGHYFVASMTLSAQPRWYYLPEVGQARCGAEGFVRLGEGSWLMGFGRQNGTFACLNVQDGSLRWELPVAASCSDVAGGDVDGDGQEEFVFGTSHGQLWAVGDAAGQPRAVWTLDLGASVGPPLLADVNGDGHSEVVVCTLDGYLNILGE